MHLAGICWLHWVKKPWPRCIFTNSSAPNAVWKKHHTHGLVCVNYVIWISEQRRLSYIVGLLSGASV